MGGRLAVGSWRLVSFWLGGQAAECLEREEGAEHTLLFVNQDLPPEHERWYGCFPGYLLTLSRVKATRTDVVKRTDSPGSLTKSAAPGANMTQLTDIFARTYLRKEMGLGYIRLPVITEVADVLEALGQTWRLRPSLSRRRRWKNILMPHTDQGKRKLLSRCKI